MSDRPVNPYEAPQSDLSPVKVPMAEEVLGRQLFPEWDTVKLKRLCDASDSLRTWSLLSLIYGLAFTVVLMNFTAMFFLNNRLLLISVELWWMLSVICFWLGCLLFKIGEEYRTTATRTVAKYGILLVIVTASVWVVKAGYDMFASGSPYLLIVLMALLLVALPSAYAWSALQVPELFAHPVPKHRDLAKEYRYRKRHGIT